MFKLPSKILTNLTKGVFAIAVTGLLADASLKAVKRTNVKEVINKVRNLGEPPYDMSLQQKPVTVGVSPHPHMVSREDEPFWAERVSSWQPEKLSGIKKWAAYLWASPITLIGATLGFLSQGKFEVHDGTLHFTDIKGPFAALLKMQNTAAITFGHSQLYRTKNPSETLVNHENVHTRQAERLGIGFGILYWYFNLYFGYGRNPFELAARKGATADKTPKNYL